MSLSAFRIEFARYRRLAEGALDQVPEEALGRELGADGNSIAILVGHLAGNLRSRFTDFLTSDGEKSWRERDREFLDPGLARAELMERWSEAWAVLESTLEALGEADLERRVVIRGTELSVAEALARSSCHVAYHVGQLVLLARHAVGADWRSLSIPKGGSQAYNRNPTLER